LVVEASRRARGPTRTDAIDVTRADSGHGRMCELKGVLALLAGRPAVGKRTCRILSCMHQSVQPKSLS
jgi:hypothetical protein